jgi:hypothetical protein
MRSRYAEVRLRTERIMLLTVLARHGGRVARAARELGVYPTTIYSRMRRLHITRAEINNLLGYQGRAVDRAVRAVVAGFVKDNPQLPPEWSPSDSEESVEVPAWLRR